MGPFALADLVGIDVQHGVMELMYALFYNEPAFAPFPLSAQRVAGGLYGQKTGAGWFRYENGKKIDAARCRRRRRAPEVGLGAPEPQHRRAAGAADRSVQAGRRQRWRRADKPSAEALIVVTPIGYDLTTAVVDLKLDPARTVAIDVLFGMKGRAR